MFENLRHCVRVLVLKRANCSPILGEHVKEVQKTIKHVKRRRAEARS